MKVASLRTLLRQGSLFITLVIGGMAHASDSVYWQKLLRNDQVSEAEFMVRLQQQPQLACDYPARYAYLREQYPERVPDAPSCPALSDWLTGIDAEQATLIFASDYLNNPSSMFGHTLLRIDAKSHSDDVRLLSYAINYSAQTNTTNGLEFAWKGLTGGYPGAFSLLPYYEKVKEYNDWESRDLWEYELALTSAEVHRLLLTYWEWQEQPRPYYFLSSNCSYELLGLLEMARPGLDLQSQFPAYAIPSDTLRTVLAQDGMLKRVTYRAASGTQRDLQLKENTAAANSAAAWLMAQPQRALPTLSTDEQAQALDLAYDELYDRHVQRQASADAPQRLRQLLVRRAALDSRITRPQPAQPKIDPSQGHDTARWGLGWGYDDRHYAVVHYRPAYHDWLDNSDGYRRGAAIDFLSGSVRFDDHTLKINHFTVVGIDSLAPINALRTPKSWAIRFGAEQILTDQRDDDRRHTSVVLDGSTGVTVALGDTLCFGQGYSSVHGGRAWQDGWQLSAGARLGCIGSISTLPLRWRIESKPQFAWPDQRMRYDTSIGAQMDLGKQQALRFSTSHQRQQQDNTTLQLDWLHYF